MLRPEQAEERLQSFQVPDGKSRRLSRTAALPDDLRRIADGLHDRRARGTELDEESRRQDVRTEAADQLAACSAPQRLQLFTALFPGIAEYVEHAWQLFVRLPYQSGYTRRAFRSLRTPISNSPARAAWIHSLLLATQKYEQEITWFAAWAPYLGYFADALGLLFASAIEAGGPKGEAVFEILLASARGEHEIGTMGRHVPRALLVASRPEGWETIEQLLLAAQRQEGLRQTILETVDEAHPIAFRRLLRLILEHDLTRFSAVIRAADVWLGLLWDVDGRREAHAALSRLLRLLEDPAARERAIAEGSGEETYLALWAVAFEDASGAVGPASRLLQDSDVERRFAAVYLLTQLGLVAAQHALLPALDDPDLRVAVRALVAFHPSAHESLQKSDLFERLKRLVPRCPKKKTNLSPILWPWMILSTDQSAAAGALVSNLGGRSPQRLIPYLSIMSPDDRARVARRLAGMPEARMRGQGAAALANAAGWDAETRATLFTLLGDASPVVRDQVLKAMARCAVTEPEALGVEALLTRKAGDLRRGILSVLLNQADAAALGSAGRLLAASHPAQRLAGLELLQELARAGRRAEECRRQALHYQAVQPRREAAADRLLAAMLDREPEAPTLENALGLLEPAERTPPAPPRAREGLALVTPAALACAQSLDDLIDRHRETAIPLQSWDGSSQEELLGNLRWGFPVPKPDLPLADDQARLPLRDVWEEWWAGRPEALRDPDGFELLRALAGLSDRSARAPDWQKALESASPGARPPKLQYPHLILGLFSWLFRLHPPAGALDFLLDAVETSFARLPEDLLKRVPDADESFPLGWRGHENRLGWLAAARQHRSFNPLEWEDRHHLRLWQLLRWLDEPFPRAVRYRPLLEEVLAAWRAGGATDADLFDQLLGPRPRQAGHFRTDFSDLQALTSRKGSPLFDRYPGLQERVERCRERILAVELARGDLPTAASAPTRALRWTGGLETLARLLQAFGPGPFVRGWSYRYAHNLERAAVFSDLIQATSPAVADTPEAFTARAEAAKLSPKRLVEVAMYAPQWAGHVEPALVWEGLAEGVWWLHAHTKDSQWSVDQEIRELWAAEVAERTPLSSQSLLDGAVDVAWFHRIYPVLGPERWKLLDGAAKYASGGGGHKRAQLFADALLGRVTKEQLAHRISEKRNADALRALGLLPLAEGHERERDLLDRYQFVQEFLRSSRQFGSQRQASEKLAAAIALQNLARTAGYPDPVRLEWAMEAQAIADLADGPITVTAGEVTVALRINEWGRPDLTAVKGDRPLKSIPAALKKEPQVAGLQSRKREIERQASRMRASLEEAMCRGDRFTGAELQTLLAHPLLTPLLRSLIFTGDGCAGYLVEGGQALEAHDERRFPLQPETSFRLAHSHDLLATGEWDLWQRDCFRRERIQPFKQVFRELYVLTPAEAHGATVSHRYDGHQVNPRQALALLGQRGWVVHPEEGVRRIFHDQGIAAWITFFEGFFTPAEVEGLTVEGVRFSRRGEWTPLELGQIPPRLFSETMRDVDLVVSVAHQGGVDPEASHSTVEMRASLIREACSLMKLTNVRLNGSHVLVDGQLSSYSVHLGSAVVHRQPGGALCIVPVHSQHRGRLFLPFADDDPRTAEVLSKVLLLARDAEIKDPTILEQILARK